MFISGKNISSIPGERIVGFVDLWIIESVDSNNPIIHLSSNPDLKRLFDVIHEDADLLVINKPAGLVCHPTKTDEYSSLIGRVRVYLGGEARGHLINRLDRETSGVVLVAKDRLTAGQLGKLWEGRAVEKEYLAIVHGHV